MIALAAVAHPDDIEFMMSGTLLQLADAGWEVHFWNLANGSCGTMTHDPESIVRIRRDEARAAAALAGATHHDPLFADLSVFFDAPSIASVAAVIREIGPDIILTHSPNDYMEDHESTCRLVTTAAFARGMPNFATVPSRPPVSHPVRVYHALPHGLRDGLGRLVQADFFVDVSPVIARKRELLACHASQNAWLDASQGMNAYLDEMESLTAEMGKLSGTFALAEGFLRHSHLGFCGPEFCPLTATLKTSQNH